MIRWHLGAPGSWYWYPVRFVLRGQHCALVLRYDTGDRMWGMSEWGLHLGPWMVGIWVERLT